jgi:hypothetical protein
MTMYCVKEKKINLQEDLSFVSNIHRDFNNVLFLLLNVVFYSN